MSRVRPWLPIILLLSTSGLAAPKPHAIFLGQWHTVKTQDPSLAHTFRIRRLIVDGRVKEYTTGVPHDVTDRLFVIERAYRLNDSLPDESATTPHWTWQAGGWISVDRLTGHVASLNLPSFDPIVSAASWYRDYVAYCGVSDDGSKSYMMVSQLGRRKPILKKEFSGSTCSAPKWERAPSRVTFAPPDGVKATFVVQGRSADPTETSGQEESQQ